MRGILRASDSLPLAAILETLLGDYFKQRLPVISLRREACPYWSDFHTERISVLLANGKRLGVFFKDFGFSSVPRAEQLRVGRREIDAYRLLSESGVMGPPKLYGWIWDPERQRYWLFLEDVGHWRLEDGIFRDWIRAVRWLGRLHGRFLDQEQAVKSAIKGLPVYHRGYYTRTADQAHGVLQRSVRIRDRWSRFRRRDADRLQSILEFFPKVARHLDNQERTLIHGDCFSQNVLLRAHPTRPNERPTVCVVDWETVALGPGALDLLGLLFWWVPPKTDTLIDHYLDAFRRKSGRRVDRRLFSQTLECCWVYDTVANVAHMEWGEDRYGLSRRYLGLSYRLKRIEQFMQAGWR